MERTGRERIAMSTTARTGSPFTKTLDLTSLALPNPPPNWGSDEVTRFFDTARGNQYATFANLHGEFQRLIAIDRAYRKLVDNLNHSKDWFAAFFVLRAHSNFLAGARLATSGQLSEAYAACVQRSKTAFTVCTWQSTLHRERHG